MKRKKNVYIQNSSFHYDSGNCRSLDGTGVIKDLNGVNNATNTGAIYITDGNNKVIRFDDSSDELMSDPLAIAAGDRVDFQITIRGTGLNTVQTYFRDYTSLVLGEPKLQLYRLANSNNLLVRYARPSVNTVDITYSNFFANVIDEYITIYMTFSKGANVVQMWRNGTRWPNVAIVSDALYPNLNNNKYFSGVPGFSQAPYALMDAVMVGGTGQPNGNFGANGSTTPVAGTIGNPFPYRFRDLDPEASIFFNVTGITDPQIRNAVNQLVLDLKQHNIWSKLACIYPFVGGTAVRHSHNLKRPGLIGTITWVGGVTHDSSGVTFNGTTGYGNTNLTLSNAANFMSSANGGFGFYTSTGHQGIAGSFECGTRTTNIGGLADMRIRDFNDDIRMTFNHQVVMTGSQTEATGFHLMSRTSTTNLFYQKNGNIVLRTTNTNAGTIVATNVFIGCLNNTNTAVGFSDRTFSFFCNVSQTFTESDGFKLNKIVQKFQTLLGRQVGTPAV
jgi:hypothetical protein